MGGPNTRATRNIFSSLSSTGIFFPEDQYQRTNLTSSLSRMTISMGSRRWRGSLDLTYRENSWSWLIEKILDLAYKKFACQVSSVQLQAGSTRMLVRVSRDTAYVLLWHS